MAIIGGVIVMNTVVAFIAKLDDGEYHKFHDFSGFPGILMISI